MPRVRQLRVDRQFQRADELARDCLERQPGNLELRIEHLRILAAIEGASKALNRVRELISEHPENVELRVFHIRLLKQTGAAGAALRAIEGFPDELERPSELFELEGILRVWEEDYEGAIEAFDTRLERSDGSARVHYYRGIAFEHRGEREAAERAYRRACNRAPEATKACAALDALAKSSTSEVFAKVRPGYSQVVGRLDGWSVDGEVGVELDRNTTLQAGVEWRTRSFGGNRLQDVLATFQASTGLLDGLRLTGGGAVGIDPDFTPAWNAFLEAGYLFDGGVQPALRLWRIQFPNAGVTVFVPRGTLYANPFFVQAQYYVTVPDSGEVSVAGFARTSYYFDYPSSVSVGFGAGNRSDFLEFRRNDAESHLVALAGISWAFSDRTTVGLEVVHRRERSGSRRYIQTQFLLNVEYRAPFGGGE